ncbi:hypothetical protein [Streptomyces sp. NPDC047097]|uniref:hypothetical protein n=1 Tax=Streptomyces sp. NPDC047097 TaxID=3155260 RepID=UPI0033C37E88
MNGKTGSTITLTAADVGAVPIWGGTVDYTFGVNAPTDTEYASWYYKKQGKTRWVMELNGASETGSDAGSDWSLTNWADDGTTWKSAVLFARRATGNVGVGTTSLMNGARLTVNGAVGLRDLTADPAASSVGAQVYSKAGKAYVQQADGSILQLGAGGAVTSVNGKSGAVALSAVDVAALASTARGAAGGVASLDAGGKVPISQVPNAARNSWTPQALGFQAWSVDPAAVANPSTLKAVVVGRLYLAGINITEPTSVGKVVLFARGWGGSTLIPAARLMAGIYNEAGTRLAWTGATPLSNVPAAGQEPGTPADAKNNHIGAVPFGLTGAAVLQPGRYWAAFLMTAGGSTDLYYLHVQNESPSNPANFHLLGVPFMRAGYLASQTTLPASFTPANMKLDHDPIILALA